MRNPTAAIFVFLVLVLSCFSALSAQSGRCALVIRNGTGRDFHRVHISWSRDKDWGPNILQAVLRPGMSVVKGDMVPAEYDMLLVDGNQRQCALRSIKVYSDTTLNITDDLLASQCR